MKQVKKRIARNDASKTAETNRALFGRTRADKSRDKSRAEKARQAVEAHRIDNETAK